MYSISIYCQFISASTTMTLLFGLMSLNLCWFGVIQKYTQAVLHIR